MFGFLRKGHYFFLGELQPLNEAHEALVLVERLAAPRSEVGTLALDLVLQLRPQHPGEFLNHFLAFLAAGFLAAGFLAAALVLACAIFSLEDSFSRCS